MHWLLQFDNLWLFDLCDTCHYPSLLFNTGILLFSGYALIADEVVLGLRTGDASVVVGHPYGIFVNRRAWYLNILYLLLEFHGGSVVEAAVSLFFLWGLDDGLCFIDFRLNYLLLSVILWRL